MLIQFSSVVKFIFFFTIFFVIIMGYTTLRYKSIISSQQRKISTLSKRNKKMLSQLKAHAEVKEEPVNNTEQPPQKVDFTITYFEPVHTTGIITASCDMCLSPVSSSPVIKELVSNTKIKLLDSAKVVDTYWLYIELIGDSNVNSKGWILEDMVTIVKEDIPLDIPLKDIINN